MGIGQTRGTTVVVVDDNDNGEFDVDALIWIRSVGEFLWLFLINSSW